jgi:hypothetical protein
MYSEPPCEEFMREIGEVNYYKCKCCGFVISKTHTELPSDVWNKLNHDWHHFFETHQATFKLCNQPPYAEQALMLHLLSRNEIINSSKWIDYAAGYGTLSKILKRYFDIQLPIYDLYVQSNNDLKYIKYPIEGDYNMVINSAMFEHVLNREDLDKVNKLVSPDGCLVIHTVVCENIPKNPDWFYLTPPVHSAFHTNKSMGILMEQWGYKASIYSPKSKSWILFKSKELFNERLMSLNCELQADWFYSKNGFMDYWKGF